MSTAEPDLRGLAQASWVVATQLDDLGAGALDVYALEARTSLAGVTSCPVTVVLGVDHRDQAELVAGRLGLPVVELDTSTLYVRSGDVLGLHVEVYSSPSSSRAADANSNATAVVAS